MQEHDAQGGSQTKIITADTGQFKALVELIRSDSFAMSFQNVRQYRQALIRGAESAAAPDVAALVEALEAVVFYHEEVEDNDGNLMMHYSKMLRKVRDALAAYRKGGDI